MNKTLPETLFSINYPILKAMITVDKGIMLVVWIGIKKTVGIMTGLFGFYPLHKLSRKLTAVSLDLDVQWSSMECSVSISISA